MYNLERKKKAEYNIDEKLKGLQSRYKKSNNGDLLN